MFRFVLFLCLAAGSFAVHAAPALSQKITRVWKSSDGRELSADLLEYDAKEIRLKRTTDLQIMKVPLSAFCEEDQKFVKGLVHERYLDSSLKKGPYAEKLTGAFVKTVSNQGLNYQLYGNPKWDSAKRYPLLIWLHGSGQSGSDNEAQMGGPTKVFTDPEQQSKNPCFMIAPQCPDAAIGWNKEVADHLMALIADLCDKLPVDMSRIYLTGSSMGGSGSWRLAAKYPEVWAAVVPLCGGTDPKNAEILKKVPIWVFHGDKDDMVSVENSRKMVAAIKEVGGTLCKYDELAGAPHGISGMVYPRSDLHEWLFKQRRNAVRE